MTGYAGILASLAAILTAVIAFLGASNVNVAVTPVNDAFGAVSVLSSPIEINGTQEYRNSTNIRSATSTLCSFKTPAATSTGFVTVRFRTSPFPIAYQIVSDTSTQNGTSSTAINLGNIQSAATGIGYSSSTNVALLPNTFINVVLSTSSATTVGANVNPAGLCTEDLWVE